MNNTSILLVLKRTKRASTLNPHLTNWGKGDSLLQKTLRDVISGIGNRRKKPTSFVGPLKASKMGHFVMVSLWCESLSLDFAFFILE